MSPSPRIESLILVGCFSPGHDAVVELACSDAQTGSEARCPCLCCCCGTTDGLLFGNSACNHNGDVNITTSNDITDANLDMGALCLCDWCVHGCCIMQAERWALIGNAVTVPVAKWLGDRLMQPYR